MDQIAHLLATGHVIHCDGFDTYAERDSERVEDLDWRPDKGTDLHTWLQARNRLWAVQTGGQVRATLMGFERIRVPQDLLRGIREDGESRVWVQGGYTFSVVRGDDGRLLTGLLGIPPGGSASQAWNQEVTKVGTGPTFLAAVDDAFDTEAPLDD